MPCKRSCCLHEGRKLMLAKKISHTKEVVASSSSEYLLASDERKERKSWIHVKVTFDGKFDPTVA